MIDREAGTITLEHVTSKVDVKQSREPESKETHFKPRPARKSKSSSRLEDHSSSSSSRHHSEGPLRKRPDTKKSDNIKPPKQPSGNMPEIIGMSSSGDPGRGSNNDSRTGQSNNPLGFLSSESDSNQEDSSSSSSTSSDNDDESDDSNNGGQQTNKQESNPPQTTTDMADFGLDLSSESSSDDSDGS